MKQTKKTEPIIVENEINETAARKFLYQGYDGLDLLPSVPDVLSICMAAEILNISEQTVSRMVADKELELKKDTLLTYIFKNFKANFPVLDDPNSPNLPQIDP